MNKRITGSLPNEHNPKWPPKVGSLIIMEHPNYKNNLFMGSVYENLLEGGSSIGAIILLLNNREHTEPALEHRGLIPKGSSSKGLFLLLQIHGWRYVDLNKYNNLFGKHGSSADISKMHTDIKAKFDGIIKSPHLQSDLGTEAIYSNPSQDKNGKEGQCMTTIDDGFKDTSLLSKLGEEHFDGLFKEKEVNKSLFDPRERFRQLGPRFKKALLLKLNSGETISEKNTKIVVSEKLSVANLIESKQDELDEGQKIVKWLSVNLINKKSDDVYIFGDIKISIFNGYVHLSRRGIRADDVITPELVPKLKYFKWQYGIPIDYDTLKYTLFQSTFQEKLQRDIEQQKEAESIFSQEYMIALQPEPKYHMWALTRLIMAWYADDYLQFNIRKIKVIINQWRCKSDQEFNQKYGILPSIVIYPRYGQQSAREVLTKISHYFMLYQSIGWKCATPSYFVKVNDLVWYTNGSIDLKLYFRKSLGSYDGKVENKSFNDTFSGIISADKLLFPYKEEAQKDK